MQYLFSVLYSLDDIVLRFYDAVFREHSTQCIEGIHRGVLTKNSSGVEHAAAAYISMICQDAADLAKSRFIVLLPADDHIRAVCLQVGADRAGAHVGKIAKDGVADIIVVRHLYFFQQNAVF